MSVWSIPYCDMFQVLYTAISRLFTYNYKQNIQAYRAIYSKYNTQ